jgi:hypothetical protein
MRAKTCPSATPTDWLALGAGNIFSAKAPCCPRPGIACQSGNCSLNLENTSKVLPRPKSVLQLSLAWFNRTIVLHSQATSDRFHSKYRTSPLARFFAPTSRHPSPCPNPCALNFDTCMCQASEQGLGTTFERLNPRWLNFIAVDI